jgi:hypothetical protein
MNTFFARLWTEQLDRVPAADGKRLLSLHDLWEHEWVLVKSRIDRGIFRV